MPTPQPRRRHLRGPAATALTALLLLPSSAAVAMDAGAADAEPLATAAAGTAASLDELHALVDDLSLANHALQADNSTLLATIGALETERDRLRTSLERFDDLYDPLEADRQLLFELRKGLPDTRPEAEAQLARIRSLALTADPSTLGQVVDRVDDSAPAFLDWRFGEFDSTEDFTDAYIDSGANAFDSSMDELRSEVLLSVANRLDGLLTILDRLR